MACSIMFLSHPARCWLTLSMPKCIPILPPGLHVQWLSVCDVLVTFFTVKIITYLICNVCLNSEGTSFSVSWHGFSFYYLFPLSVLNFLHLHCFASCHITGNYEVQTLFIMKYEHLGVWWYIVGLYIGLNFIW